MSSNHQPPPGDRLDRAAAAVRGAAVPPPPAELLAATGAAVHNRLTLAAAADVARRRRRTWIMRGISVGGLAACLAVAVTWGGGRAMALDPVIQKMKAAESARFTIERTLGDQKPVTQKYWVRGDRMRIEFADAGTVIVTDLKLKRGLLINPPAKMFHRLPRPGAQIAVGDGKTPLEQFLAIRDAKAERLGQEAVDGVNADKLKVVRPAADGNQASTWTVWLDPATTLPVKIVSTGATVAGDEEVAVESVFTDFAWNEKFADDLFSLDPPAGYVEGSPGRNKPSAERTHQVSLKLALDNQAKAKSFRAVSKTEMAGKPAAEQRLFIQGDKMRIEMGDTTSVSDGKRLVMLDGTAKVARTLTLDPDAPSDAANGVAGGVKQVVDALEGKGKAEPVPAVEIGGKKRPGFKVAGVSYGPGLTAEVTYYLDEEKDLPLRFVSVLSGPVRMTSTMDYLAFDEELDPKLFDQTIPAGYKQEELKLPADKK